MHGESTVPVLGKQVDTFGAGCFYPCLHFKIWAVEIQGAFTGSVLGPAQDLSVIHQEGKQKDEKKKKKKALQPRKLQGM